MSLQYRQLEKALAAVCDVTADNMGAFRARLRHLRNIGLPRLPKPGSGRQISYSERQALEMLIALIAGQHGFSPRNAAVIAQSIVRQSPYGQHQGNDCFIVVNDPKSPRYFQALGHRQLAEVLKRPAELFLVLNISAFVRKLDHALDQAVKTDR